MYVFVRDDVTNTQVVGDFVTTTANTLVGTCPFCYVILGGSFTDLANTPCGSESHQLDVWAYDYQQARWTFGGYVRAGGCLR